MGMINKSATAAKRPTLRFLQTMLAACLFMTCSISSADIDQRTESALSRAIGEGRLTSWNNLISEGQGLSEEEKLDQVNSFTFTGITHLHDAGSGFNQTTQKCALGDDVGVVARICRRGNQRVRVHAVRQRRRHQRRAGGAGADGGAGGRAGSGRTWLSSGGDGGAEVATRPGEGSPRVPALRRTASR